MDYYIRSWDPDSTYPANPQEGDVCYTITLDQSWAPVAGVKNDNLLKEEVYENGEWKEVGGGGGGDMTLASGKITNTQNESYTLYLCMYDGVQEGSVTYAQLLPDIPREFQVILYKGVAMGSIMYGPEEGTVVGDAEYYDGDLLVTGDFTLTI